MKTTDKYLEAQLKEAESKNKLKMLNLEQDRLTIFAYMCYAIIVGAAIMLITI